MGEVLKVLDASPAVARYAWYSARDMPIADTNSGNLLEWNVTTPTLTTTGAVYKAHAQNTSIPTAATSV